ncbi:MAG: hypothetical protein Q4E87_01170 [bacterium]|nr:hypothetical protein [bacterium]
MLNFSLKPCHNDFATKNSTKENRAEKLIQKLEYPAAKPTKIIEIRTILPEFSFFKKFLYKYNQKPK